MRYFLENLYSVRVAVVAVADALCLVAAVAVAVAACWLAAAQPALALPIGALAAATAAGVLGCFVALYYCDAYRLIVMADWRRSARALLAAAGVALFAALALSLLVRLPPAVEPLLACSAAVYFPLLLAERALVRALYCATAHRVAILGTGDLAFALADALSERRAMGFDFAGFIAEAPERRLEDVPVLGDVKELHEVIASSAIDTVLVAVQDRDVSFPQLDLLDAKLRAVRIESGVRLYERMTGRLYLRGVRPSYLIFSDGFRMGRVAAALKRGFDVLCAGAGLLLASPLLALACAAIRLDSAGPLFYRQQRVGQGGRIFSIVKLRSMVQGAEAASGPVWARGRGDARVTRVGRILRRTRLDELPQLWNVLIGDMSLVGPRPERPEFVRLLSAQFPYFRLRSAVKPGVTGWAQVRHGYVNDVEGCEEKLALDLFYMKHQSLLLDLLILWKTLRTVVLLQGV